jgi:5-methyltetrahydrofolate--homocysteine methyltransferase
MNTPNRLQALTNALEKRILILDGAMGTLIQDLRLTEADFRGQQFQEHTHPLKGCNDLLVLTQPEHIQNIHRAYLVAGADILETNSFNATTIAMADYGLENQVFAINQASAAIARTCCAELEAETGRIAWVAGVLGPTNRTASISPEVENPGARNTDFESLRSAYFQACLGLLDGGADIILVETIFDTLNAKAALFAVEEAFEQFGERRPIFISATITDASGRTLSGQTPEAFYNAIAHAQPAVVGLNCALGAHELRQHVSTLSRIAACGISAHPNAGLPNELGGYDESPEEMAVQIQEWAEAGLLNVVGGCCGTTPDHIRAMAQAVQGRAPRTPPALEPLLQLSGLEAVAIGRETDVFVNIGERTNVTGSARFRRLVEDDRLNDALVVARRQVERGAQLIDINMDEGLLDSEACMRDFLNLIASEPDISRVPVVIDSSKWSVIEAGLQCLQGKGIVNSISLKEGEAEFLKQARLVRRYGAAVIVMAFDEQGQADSTERKVDICSRAYQLLTERVGFPPQDIIFDPNIFAIGTGIAEHANYAVSFFEAIAALKERFPLAKISGGVSNVSFAFRGNNGLREAIHSVFLLHAIQAGMDMGIVNAGQLVVADQIPETLRERVLDLVLNRREDATDRLLELADTVSAKAQDDGDRLAWREHPLAERITYAMINGIDQFIVEDAELARLELGSALKVIEGPLMDGMNAVGERFGAGQMFLPQVVKSARVMKRAVNHLEPFLSKDASGKLQKKCIVLATVKGDVHDIGKNIVGVVLQCNGFRVVDLGVMVPAQTILDTAIRENAEFIGLSGLITPSLDEMVYVAQEMHRQSISLPLLIGGATTSKVHTAVRIVPATPHCVVHVQDASKAVGVLTQLANPELAKAYSQQVSDTYDALRIRHQNTKRRPRTPLAKARKNAFKIDFPAQPAPQPKAAGIHHFDSIPIAALRSFIDWSPFFSTWDIPGQFPRILDDPEVGEVAKSLYADALAMLETIEKEHWIHTSAICGILPAHRTGDDVEVIGSEGPHRFHFLRQQAPKSGGRPHYSLADFIAEKNDHLGCFVVQAGRGVAERVRAFQAQDDDYNAILLEALADRLAEACAEWLHAQVRRELWGYEKEGPLAISELVAEGYQGIRPAPGYPACPDHSEKAGIFKLLNATEKLGVTLTESMAMTPTAAVSGWYFAHSEAHYFGIGKIDTKQLEDYARRKGWSQPEAERWLRPNLI